MKLRVYDYATILFLFTGVFAWSQETAGTANATTPLFSDTEPLQVKLTYSNKDLIKKTNDSTYLDVAMHYRVGDQEWDSIPVRLQERGNWRQKNCFLSPVKVRIKKKDAKGTLFEGNKELKFVLPCGDTDFGMDYVLKELLAYRMYESVTPYHFKTRRIELEYTDEGRRDKQYMLEAFMIEDISTVADRNGADRLKRSVHPLQQDHLTSVQNDFFQYMIANTDYSSAYQHNEKLLFVKGRQAIPVPYDFDMSGFVNANYAVVSQVQGEVLPIKKVTQRMYRGFKRNPEVYDMVRKQFLELRPEFVARMEELQPVFRNEKQYKEASEFIDDFFAIIKNDSEYRESILAVARIK